MTECHQPKANVRLGPSQRRVPAEYFWSDHHCLGCSRRRSELPCQTRECVLPAERITHATETTRCLAICVVPVLVLAHRTGARALSFRRLLPCAVHATT